jgi:hypothetical protein
MYNSVTKTISNVKAYNDSIEVRNMKACNLSPDVWDMYFNTLWIINDLNSNNLTRQQVEEKRNTLSANLIVLKGSVIC